MAIKTSVAQGIARLTLDRPEKRNAFDDTTISAINAVLAEWRQSDTLRAVMIDARGKTFCAGADLGWMKRSAQLDDQANLADAQALAEMMAILDNLKVPVITLVQGAAFGGGLGIICCSDLVLATDDARFCLSEVRLGLVPAVISPYVIRAMGVRQARRYMLTAELISAADALRLNLIHQCHGDYAALCAEAETIVAGLINNSPAAVRSCKQLIARVGDRPIDRELLHYTSQMIAKLRKTPEAQEGLSAFFEQRKPNWADHSSD